MDSYLNNCVIISSHLRIHSLTINNISNICHCNKFNKSAHIHFVCRKRHRVEIITNFLNGTDTQNFLLTVELFKVRAYRLGLVLGLGGGGGAVV